MKEIEASLQRICNFKYNLEAILAEFKVGDLNELLDELLYTFKDSIDEFVYRPDYVDLFHDFLYALTESTSNPDDLDSIGVFDKRLFNIVKAEIKPYNNKKIKLEKDDRYNILNRLKSNLDAQYLTASNKMINIREDDNTRVLKFIIYEIKNPDILYQLLESKSEIVNKYIYDEHILHYIIKEFIINMDSMTKEDKEYFKRIISMMLIRNELKIYEKDFRDIYTDLDCKISKKENVRDCSYLKYIIQKHFEIRDPAPTIGSEFKEFKEVERDRQYDLQIIPDIDRYDLRSLPTFSIDYIKYAKAKKLLFDDAFSIEPTEFGTYALYFHRPDVDEYIPRDQLFDKYMKDRVMSIYSKPVIPMIPYKYACKMSLLKKEDRLALTTRVHIDKEGNILGVQFLKSIIRVQDNMSKNKADILMKDDEYEFKWLLELMYEIALILRNKRGEKPARRGKAGLIMDEFNIFNNLVIADFFVNTPLPFAYKNYHEVDFLSQYGSTTLDFVSKNRMDEDTKSIILGLQDTKGRNTYSIHNTGNDKFNGLPYTNVGNPLREYISLEIDRLIKDIMIDKYGSYSVIDYWGERIEKDCIEQTENIEKVKGMYKD